MHVCVSLVSFEGDHRPPLLLSGLCNLPMHERDDGRQEVSYGQLRSSHVMIR